MGRGKARSSRDLPKPINASRRKMIEFGLWLMGFAKSSTHPTILILAPVILALSAALPPPEGRGNRPSPLADHRLKPAMFRFKTNDCMRRCHSSLGFSLIEMMVGIAILARVSIIALPLTKPSDTLRLQAAARDLHGALR